MSTEYHQHRGHVYTALDAGEYPPRTGWKAVPLADGDALVPTLGAMGYCVPPTGLTWLGPREAEAEEAAGPAPAAVVPTFHADLNLGEFFLGASPDRLDTDILHGYGRHGLGDEPKPTGNTARDFLRYREAEAYGIQCRREWVCGGLFLAKDIVYQLLAMAALLLSAVFTACLVYFASCFAFGFVPSLLLFAIPCRSVRKTKLWARAVAASYAWLKATPGWPDDAALVQMKAGLRADLARAAQDAQAKLAAFDAKEGNLKANLGKVTAVLASPMPVATGEVVSLGVISV